MAKCWAAAVGTSSGSNVYVSFDGLAELLQGPLTVNTVNRELTQDAPAPAKALIDVMKWPEMDLD